ncbi:prepilin-type N-terminal cleavage/methylation domain-containing protein [Rubrivivax gelatinosus]|uniref:Prepilin-type N-terminal cleavage/methylation domain-containing protein n=1 Tax=Rubrivivax gelatinosus TaxID=28068 RepID=A0A4R2M319_RUBGE|nr:prepilin-type N-terminal cleavage/methylation domain-containing protein [Rubrivivax gelatinosus]MBK1689721.1 hypothetical protein [Rubrivivax gelatinosus]TCP01519.1 prepilin-type N-terminal cleavage/methylation domain-containing protein [Rubrivivax gelatinosus]
MPSFPACPPPPARPVRGFTLTELLIVVAVLAAVAALGWSAYAGVQRDAQARLAQVQLRQLAQALRHFRDDTGHWPGSGPFALASATNVESGSAGTVSCSDTGEGLWLRSSLPALALGSGDVETWRARWFAHPANLWSLVNAPRLCANHALGRLQRWDPLSGRGWRGPYLRPESTGWVDVGDGLDATGGDPLGGELQRDLRGLPAGTALQAVDAAGADCSRLQDGCRWRWHTLAATAGGYDPAAHDEGSHPRPLLYFGPASGRVRVAWTGSDGRWGGFAADAPCDANAATEAGRDDVVICLE